VHDQVGRNKGERTVRLGRILEPRLLVLREKKLAFGMGSYRGTVVEGQRTFRRFPKGTEKGDGHYSRNALELNVVEPKALHLGANADTKRRKAGEEQNLRLQLLDVQKLGREVLLVRCDAISAEHLASGLLQLLTDNL